MWDLKKLKEDLSQNKIEKAEYIKEMHKIHSILFEYAEFIEDTDIYKIEITNKQVIMTSKEDSIKIICDKDDHRIAPIEILNFNKYEPLEIEWIIRLIKTNLRKDFNFFDIGANIGWYSLKIAKQFPHSNVYAFEPIQKTFNQLRRNIEINSQENIEIFNFGFSNKAGEVIFYYHEEQSGAASLANLYDKVDTKQITAKVKTIDEFIEEKNLSIDLIKCDVEGAELFVYEGGLNTLKSDKPIIFSEMLRKWAAKLNYNPNEIIKTLGDLGYKCYKINKEKLIEFEEMTESTKETNFFFLHPEKHKLI